MAKPFTRFTLRALFVVVTAICCALGVIVYDIHWIRDRHQACRKYGVSLTGFGHGEQPFAPSGLWLFGEQGIRHVAIVVEWECTEAVDNGRRAVSSQHKLIQRMRQLFPEAEISACARDPSGAANHGSFYGVPAV